MSCFWGSFLKTFDPSCITATVYAQPISHGSTFVPGSLLSVYQFSDLTSPLSPAVAQVTHVKVWTTLNPACDYCDWVSRNNGLCILGLTPYAAAWGSNSQSDPANYPVGNDGSLGLVLNTSASYAFDPTSADMLTVLDAQYAPGGYIRVARLTINTDVGEMQFWIGDSGCY